MCPFKKLARVGDHKKLGYVSNGCNAAIKECTNAKFNKFLWQKEAFA